MIHAKIPQDVPLWVRFWLLGARRRSTAILYSRASLVLAALFVIYGFVGNWAFLMSTLGGDPLAVAIGMALLPDLRLPGVLAGGTMCVVAFGYWKTLPWLDTMDVEDTAPS